MGWAAKRYKRKISWNFGIPTFVLFRVIPERNFVQKQPYPFHVWHNADPIIFFFMVYRNQA
jgi:hypothetical protein